SDVSGDEPSVIASGPTVPDATTLADARAVLTRYRIEPMAAVRQALESPDNETPKEATPDSEFHIIANARTALDAAVRAARQAGIKAQIVGHAVEGEARGVGA